MLMRSPTRIEFRVEDAQDYIRGKERQKQRGQTCTLPPVPGASPVNAISEDPPDLSESREEQEAEDTERFQSGVQQLAQLGIDEQDARRALRATGERIVKGARWRVAVKVPY
ncbi:unnamed protein product [Effrenium voratum]|uniref:Uncharacterized protein n=1 Tax=Effrenium voratum TaxID=2562239 RepID=A0AA36I429_9DINO|nr:unnamed protein product [Effrenium voratum]CAJ1461915.1 unnamed protein product [Effrenium voratum]